MNVIWKDIADYEGRYSISLSGLVRRNTAAQGAKVGRILKPQMHQQKYLRVNLYKNGKMQYHKVHILVIKTFLGARPTGYQINHKNGIKTDNRIENLEYVTPRENILHAWTNGLSMYTKNEKGRFVKKQH